MSDGHIRFRESLAAHLAELLSEDDSGWMEAHAAECASCAALLARAHARLPELSADADHVPVAVLEKWVHERGRLTPLECELLQRHLAGCETCRGDAEEMARLGGLAPVTALRPSTVRPRRGALAVGVVAAATLVVVFAIWLREEPLPGTPVPMLPPEGDPRSPAGAPVARETRTIVLLDRVRSGAGAALPEAGLPRAGDTLRLQIPPLFLEEKEDVLARLLGAGGDTVWETRLPARALRDDLVPTPPRGGWSVGPYRLLIIPAAGRDTGATREFSFQLRASSSR